MGNHRTPGVSVYARAGRQVYYISYRDPLQPEKGRVHQVTPYRTDDPEGLKKAHALAMDKAQASRIEGDAPLAERWENWVIPFLRGYYSRLTQALTLQRHLGAWKWLSLFLIREVGVRLPRGLMRKHVLAYPKWRTAFKRRSGRLTKTSTAVTDLACLYMVMQEAVDREWADANPCQKLRIRADEARHARDLLPHELALIEERLPAFIELGRKDREWMLTAYKIARYQGCRSSETRIRLSDVSLERGTILLFTKGRKGGAGEVTMMHPKLRPLFAQMIAEGREWTLDLPRSPSVKWRRFFDWIGLKDAWFHCLRSTVITEMARNGVPISQAMRYILHATEAIHRAYQKLGVNDLGVAAAAIGGAATTPAGGTERLQAALIAELVRGGMGLAEAMQKVVPASSSQTPLPVAHPSSPAPAGADTPASS